MLSIPELEALLVDHESDRSERKERFVDHDRIRQAICAFALARQQLRKNGNSDLEFQVEPSAVLTVARRRA